MADASVLNNRAQRRYEIYVGDAIAGLSEYHLRGNNVVFIHTEIDPAFEGQGLGSRLIREALDDVKAQGLTVTPRCPFVASFIGHPPDYQPLVQ